MLTTCPSSVDATTGLRDGLGQLEDEAAVSGWAWDAALSQRVDWLIVALEERSA